MQRDPSAKSTMIDVNDDAKLLALAGKHEVPGRKQPAEIAPLKFGVCDNTVSYPRFQSAENETGP